MASISLQIPVLSSPNSVEDPKIISDFTTLQTWANGNVDTNNLNASAGILDAQLASPNNATRRSVARATGVFSAGLTSADYVFFQSGNPVVSGAAVSGDIPPIFLIDPTTYAVTGKTTHYILRETVITNAVSPGITDVFGSLYILTSSGGTGGQLSVGFGTPQAHTAGLTGGNLSAESAPFTVSGTSFAMLGANLNGTIAANAVLAITVELYAVFT